MGPSATGSHSLVMTQPTSFSVLTPDYNHTRYLPAALEAILAPSGRANPITHKPFDIAGLMRSLLAFRPAPRDTGLRLALARTSG